MKISVIIIILHIIVNEIHGKTSDSLRITLPNGSKLIGRHMISSEGKGIRAFMGIPYAEPPVGPLRFRAPIPKAPWTGERRAIKDPEMCSQQDPYFRKSEVSGSEDCLYLNVYTPQITTIDQPLSVMLFFHGGGWVSGAGSCKLYGPDFLLNHNIIYVSGNYRLGALGFLSTEQEDCPGNFGLKDQALMLKWIQENIKVFGGNPNSVTIFGESAGGASVSLAMQSPLTKGMFHRAISQSGTSLSSWGAPMPSGIASKRTKKVAELVGCPKSKENTWQTVIDCMRNVSHDKITQTLYEFRIWDIQPAIPFRPVIEANLPGAYLIEHPRDARKSYGMNVPWMTGITYDEGVLMTALLTKRSDLYDDLKYRSEEIYPSLFNYDHHDQLIQNEITRKINEFYFNGELPIMEKNKQNITNLLTDGWFLHALDESLNIRLMNTNSADTYVYTFGHLGQSSLTEILDGGVDEIHGVSHIDDLFYLFPMEKELFVTTVPNETDLKIRKLMTEIWVNFAKTGNPTSSDDQVKWTPTKSYPYDFLRIGNRDYENQPLIAMESNLFVDRIEFCRNLKPILIAEQQSKDEL